MKEYIYIYIYVKQIEQLKGKTKQEDTVHNYISVSSVTQENIIVIEISIMVLIYLRAVNTWRQSKAHYICNLHYWYVCI